MEEDDDEHSDLEGDASISSDSSIRQLIESELYSQVYYGSHEAVMGHNETALVSPRNHIIDSAVESAVVIKRRDAHLDTVQSSTVNAAEPVDTEQDEIITIDSDSTAKVDTSSDSVDEYILLSSDDDKSADSESSASASLDSDSSDDGGKINKFAFEYNTISSIKLSVEEVLASLPNCDWRIIDADRYPYLSKGGRYYNVRCANCNERGHIMQECSRPKKKQICILCGGRGHALERCWQQLCLRCEQFGHRISACPTQRPKVPPRCNRCQQLGHLSQKCSEQWRQFHWAIQPEAFSSVLCKPPKPTPMNKLRYCANCGVQGHFTHDCNKPKPNNFRPTLSVLIKKYHNNCAAAGAQRSNPAISTKHELSDSALRQPGSGTLTGKSPICRNEADPYNAVANPDDSSRNKAGNISHPRSLKGSAAFSKHQALIRNKKRHMPAEDGGEKKAKIAVPEQQYAKRGMARGQPTAPFSGVAASHDHGNRKQTPMQHHSSSFHEELRTPASANASAACGHHLAQAASSAPARASSSDWQRMSVALACGHDLRYTSYCPSPGQYNRGTPRDSNVQSRNLIPEPGCSPVLGPGSGKQRSRLPGTSRRMQQGPQRGSAHGQSAYSARGGHTTKRARLSLPGENHAQMRRRARPRGNGRRHSEARPAYSVQHADSGITSHHYKSSGGVRVTFTY